jgi:DNA replication and repair protein RecF
MIKEDLHIKELTLTNFKNYEMQSFKFSPKLNCIVGENGMGKTNIMDAIHTFALGKSHFLSTDQNLIRFGEDFFRIQAHVSRFGKNEEIVVKYKYRTKKVIERNKIPYKKISEHIGLIPLVMIAPDDIQLIMEGSEERRRFLDLSLVQYDSVYLEQLLIYNSVLEQRNSLLKSYEYLKPFNFDLLETYDLQLIKPAQYIFEKRYELIKKLEPIFVACYASISGDKEKVNIKYTSSLFEEEMVISLLHSREKDLILQRTTKGIHKDDLELEIKGQSLKKFASQGQLKSYLLAMKLAQYEFLKEITKLSPILLLDDIFDKLDEKRVAQLLNLLFEKNFGQIFITDTHELRIESIIQKLLDKSEYTKIKIEDGTVVKV